MWLSEIRCLSQALQQLHNWFLVRRQGELVEPTMVQGKLLITVQLRSSTLTAEAQVALRSQIQVQTGLRTGLGTHVMPELQPTLC